jgi:putative FmdB family regulatory protein
MPTYEYQCGHCGRFQTTQRITEPALTVCPTCGQPVQRLISRNVGIIFKGSGFYCTDNRSNNCLSGSESKNAKAGEAAKTTEAKTTETKTTETKTTETKTATSAGKK